MENGIVWYFVRQYKPAHSKLRWIFYMDFDFATVFHIMFLYDLFYVRDIFIRNGTKYQVQKITSQTPAFWIEKLRVDFIQFESLAPHTTDTYNVPTGKEND